MLRTGANGFLFFYFAFYSEDKEHSANNESSLIICLICNSIKSL